MAGEDWALLGSSLSLATIDRGVTNAIDIPEHAGDYVFGFASKLPTIGAVGVILDTGVTFGAGANITGLIRRGPSGGELGFSPFFYLCAQGQDTGSLAYLLGLSNQHPYRIALAKNRIVDGVPPSTYSTVLRSSEETFLPSTWHHLRFDVTVNRNGEVLLDAFANDLALHSVLDPVWESIDGMSQFIDDPFGVNSGSEPYTGGLAGFGFTSSDVARRAFFGYIMMNKQVP